MSDGEADEAKTKNERNHFADEAIKGNNNQQRTLPKPAHGSGAFQSWISSAGSVGVFVDNCGGSSQPMHAVSLTDCGSLVFTQLSFPFPTLLVHVCLPQLLLAQ